MSQPTRTQAIKQFLIASTYSDLASMYNTNMEVQVNVAQDGGDRVDGEFKGRNWHAWTDGVQTWRTFRIPRNSNTEPIFEDPPMNYDLACHAEGIGMTGWDFTNLVSRWVGFDFDAICGHSDKHGKKLTDTQLLEIRNKVNDISWVTLRKSTSGTGLHLYVFLNPVTTKNHTEHAALARAILGKLSVACLFDFHSKVDIQGGILWQWHRKMKGTDGLTLLKPGTTLNEIPANWKDHIRVIKSGKTRTLPTFLDDIQKPDKERIFEELSSARSIVELDIEHKRLLDYLDGLPGAIFSWQHDHKMLTTHTSYLLQAYQELNLKGIFKTNAQGTTLPDHNCFAFVLRGGEWIVRRFSPGASEAETWFQDSGGWTTCYLNREADLPLSARANEGIERPSGGFLFSNAEQAIKAASNLGIVINLPGPLSQRQTILKAHKDGRLIVELKKEDQDQGMTGWIPEGGKWKKVFNAKVNNNDKDPEELEGINIDDYLRHLTSEGNNDSGWAIRADRGWIIEPIAHVKPALAALGLPTKTHPPVMGKCILKPWKIVNRPFEDEYPDQRLWNKDAAQLKYTPNPNIDALVYKHWLLVLNHCGNSLTPAIAANLWCKNNNILTGGDYLKLWIASLFQYPNRPLPYLFFYGEQNSGKSILHEALSLLITKGYQRADNALKENSTFNGELEKAIICIVEEIDLKNNKSAYNRMKDWVTSPLLSIHHKQLTPYLVPNYTHWIQIANDYSYCPVFPGDTRITMAFVDLPANPIPKNELIGHLIKEAPDFLASILGIDIPASNDRLNVPVIITDEKLLAQEANKTALQIYLEENCYYCPGALISIDSFFTQFKDSLDPREAMFWSKPRIAREITPQFVRGRMHGTGQWHYGNLALSKDTKPGKKWIRIGEYLEIQSDQGGNSGQVSK